MARFNDVSPGASAIRWKSRLRELALGFLLLTATPGAAVAADPAEQTLLESAIYWSSNHRPDLALAALDKLLAVNPRQPDALLQYGMIEARLQHLEEAQRYLARLRDIAPASPQAADLESMIRAGPIDPVGLSEARRLAQSGDAARAVQKYRQLFRGPPPPDYRLEYYQTLAGTPDGWDEARQGMERLVQGANRDVRVKLAFAQVLTYRETARREGIAALAQLSRDPVVGAAAMRSWRDALLWLDAKPDDRALYGQYLAENPKDFAVAKYFAEATTPAPVAPADAARAAGFAGLERGDNAAAEHAFDEALREHPQDADALGGMGVIRLRQQHFGEARDLLKRAMQAAPASAEHWTEAYESASFWAAIDDAKSARDAADYRRARSILTALLSHPHNDNWNAEAILADVETKLGDLDAAEQAYRRVLAARPKDADAALGLVGVLTTRDKISEAATLLDRLPTTGPRHDAVKHARAELLRAEAKDSQVQGRTAEARTKFQEALNADPANPWLRLDFANFLDRRGELSQAFAIVDPAASGDSPESLEAAAMFDVQQNRFADALATLDRIPASARSAGVKAYRDQILPPARIEQARRLARAGRRSEARDLLIEFNRTPPVAAEKTRTVIYELAAMGEIDSALAIARESAARGGPDATKANIDYAAMLLKSGRNADADAVLEQLRASGGIAVDDRADIDRMSATLAVSLADKLLKQGDVQRARSEIAPLLNAHPNDPALLFAMGRIAADAGDRKRALGYIDAGNRQSPTDPQSVSDAVWSAVRAKGFDRARAYLAHALKSDPKNAQFYYLQAEVARYSGDLRTAMRALETARALNDKHPQDAVAASPGVNSAPVGSAAPEQPGSPQSNAGSAEGLLIPPDAGARPLPGVSAAPHASAEDELIARRENVQQRAVRAFATRVAAAGGAAGGIPMAASDPIPAPLTVPSDAPVAPSPAAAPSEALGANIERSLAEIEAQTGPVAAAGPGLRLHAGSSGLGQLADFEAPIETRISPWYTGTAYFALTPTVLRAGTLGAGAIPQFGINPLLSAASPGLALASPGDQQATGVALSGGYSYRFFSGAVGTSPIGFPVRNLLGDIALCYPSPCGPIGPTKLSLWAGSPSDPLQFRVEGHRQSTTDTLLSYAGTKDAATGKIWGGVVKSSGRALVLYDNGTYGAIAAGGGGVLDGRNVASNREAEGLIGGFFRPWRAGDDALKVGLSLTYIGYSRNLQGFSFGQGGYFSPQNYLSLFLPVDYSGRTGALAYHAGAAVGVIHFNEDRSPFFPTNGSDQAAFQSLVGDAAFYQGRVVTTPGFNVGGQVEYSIDDGLTLGAAANVNNSRGYTEGVARLYLHDNFGVHGAPTASPGTSQ
jgi:tetratricopeptide (TPR) repeat protein